MPKKGTRKAKTDRVPRTRANGEWTEAAFWGFVRSNIRAMSRKWPPLARHALNAVRRPYVGDNKRQKWEFQCVECEGWYKRTEVEVDHIVPCGSIRSFQEAAVFMERMLVEVDGLCVRCKTCHDKKTHGKVA
jgi:hypothetical protein